MQQLPTVLLKHTTGRGEHFDWLLADPADPDGPLWTARTSVSSAGWSAAGTWLLEPIGRHRRHYLTYEGPLSADRGSVTRVDEGTFTAVTWTDDLIVIELTMRHCRGRVTLSRRSDSFWQASLEHSCSNKSP